MVMVQLLLLLDFPLCILSPFPRCILVQGVRTEKGRGCGSGGDLLAALLSKLFVRISRGLELLVRITLADLRLVLVIHIRRCHNWCCFRCGCLS